MSECSGSNPGFAFDCEINDCAIVSGVKCSVLGIVGPGMTLNLSLGVGCEYWVKPGRILTLSFSQRLCGEVSHAD